MYTKFPREYDPSMPDEQASERIGWEHDSYPQAVDKSEMSSAFVTRKSPRGRNPGGSHLRLVALDFLYHYRKFVPAYDPGWH